MTHFFPTLRFSDLCLYAVGRIEQHAEVADAPDAGFRADRRLAGLDARVAEGALLRFPGLPVVIDLLVRTARDAHPPAAAFLLIDQDDAVFLALVDGARRADRDTGDRKSTRLNSSH